MKTNIKSTLMYVGATLLFMVATVGSSNAQVANKAYFNVDWQVNIPMDNTFADKTSGWGMNFEGGYNINDKFSVGGFIAYQTNLEYIDRKTIDLTPTSAMNTDQKHALFQLPFGVSGRYYFTSGSVLNPYVSFKLGPQFTRLNSYYYVVRQYENTWGFYMSPEIGVNIFPSESMPFGFHVAAYYSYASNKGEVLNYSINGINNFGIRVGLAF